MQGDMQVHAAAAAVANSSNSGGNNGPSTSSEVYVNQGQSQGVSGRGTLNRQGTMMGLFNRRNTAATSSIASHATQAMMNIESGNSGNGNGNGNGNVGNVGNTGNVGNVGNNTTTSLPSTTTTSTSTATSPAESTSFVPPPLRRGATSSLNGSTLELTSPAIAALHDRRAGELGATLRRMSIQASRLKAGETILDVLPEDVTENGNMLRAHVAVAKSQETVVEVPPLSPRGGVSLRDVVTRMLRGKNVMSQGQNQGVNVQNQV